MSNQEARDYGRFYNHYNFEAKREVKNSYVPNAIHDADRTLTGILSTGLPIGTQAKFSPFDDSVRISNRLGDISPTKIHHPVKYVGPNLGIESCNQQVRFNFSHLRLAIDRWAHRFWSDQIQK